MKTLYLMRHGQTLFNVLKLDQGASDAPLTNLGVAQAHAAGTHLAQIGIRPDHVFASPYERTCDTAELVTAHLTADGSPLPYERIAGLREFNFGTYEGKDSYLNPALPFGDKFVPFGGDAQRDVTDRMVATLTELMSRPDVKVALAVSHGASCANFLRACQDWSPVKYHPGIKNCSVFKFEFDEKDLAPQDLSASARRFACVDLFEPDVPAESVPDAGRIAMGLMRGAGDVAAAQPAATAAYPSAPTVGPKRLWLVRHAETLFNAQHKVQGWCDSPVTERGLEQARITGRMLADLGANPDHALCSTAYRTAVTLDQILATMGRDDLSYLHLKGLREVGFGLFEAHDQCLQPQNDHGDTAQDHYYEAYQGEDRSKVAARMYASLRTLMDRPDVHEALVVSHGGSLSTFFKQCPQVVRKTQLTAFTNCMTYRYTYQDGIFTCEEVLIPDFSQLDA